MNEDDPMTPAARTRLLIDQAAKEHCVTIEDVMSPDRSREVAAARRRAIILVNANNPGITLTRLAAIFGRDFETVRYALDDSVRLRKIERERARRRVFP
jgi:chromosomal replication initiation ATPase DnaA